jgi:hypothetical protein
VSEGFELRRALLLRAWHPSVRHSAYQRSKGKISKLRTGGKWRRFGVLRARVAKLIGTGLQFSTLCFVAIVCRPNLGSVEFLCVWRHSPGKSRTYVSCNALLHFASSLMKSATVHSRRRVESKQGAEEYFVCFRISGSGYREPRPVFAGRATRRAGWPARASKPPARPNVFPPREQRL